MSCPGEQHVAAAKQAIKFLYATKDYGITYTRGAHGAPHIFMRALPGDEVDAESEAKGHEFVTYADADLAGDLDSRKSTAEAETNESVEAESSRSCTSDSS